MGDEDDASLSMAGDDPYAPPPSPARLKMRAAALGATGSVSAALEEARRVGGGGTGDAVADTPLRRPGSGARSRLGPAGGDGSCSPVGGYGGAGRCEMRFLLVFVCFFLGGGSSTRRIVHAVCCVLYEVCGMARRPSMPFASDCNALLILICVLVLMERPRDHRHVFLWLYASRMTCGHAL